MLLFLWATAGGRGVCTEKIIHLVQIIIKIQIQIVYLSLLGRRLQHTDMVKNIKHYVCEHF